MGRKTVTKCVRMNIFLEASSLGGFLASVPDHLGVNRRITGMPAVAWKQPGAGLARYSAPVLTQRFKQFWAEHHIPVFASFAALDVNLHALAIDVTDFQVGQFRASYSGGVERYQQSAMEGSAGRLNELRNFLLSEDRWQVMDPFRIGSVGDAPGSLERLTVKEPQGCQTDRDAAGGQLALLKLFRLGFPYVMRASALGGPLDCLPH